MRAIDKHLCLSFFQHWLEVSSGFLTCEVDVYVTLDGFFTSDGMTFLSVVFPFLSLRYSS